MILIMLCKIFKSKKKEDTYLFVEKEMILDELRIPAKMNTYSGGR